MLSYTIVNNGIIDTNHQIKLTDSAHMPTISTAKQCSVSQTKYLTLWFFIPLVITTVIIFYSEPELYGEEQRIMRQLGRLHIKEQHLNLWFQMLKEETSATFDQLNNAVSLLSNNTTDTDVHRVLKNLSNSTLSFMYPNDLLKPPTVYHFLPHLLSNFSSLLPAYRWSRNRFGMSTVLGIPTVKRPSQSYLLATLNDLIYKMSVQEKEDTLIVVLIAEVEESYVLQVVNDIKNLFQNELDSGLIDIISPSALFYPDFNKLPLTLSDPVDRVKWRSKQCLDFAFLMMYAYPRGMFYIQLEDDILAKENYLSIMKDVALTKIANKQPWFVLDFCQLGFIGKMFRCIDLPWIIQFFFMFYNDKPVDWLLDGFIQTKVCNLEKDNKDCKKQKDRLWVHNKPSLFQHIGTMSSLKGKVQKLKDKHFGKVPLFYPHRNPSAFVQTSIKAYKKHNLIRAYNGETFFWGLTPRIGDYISFRFKKPVRISRYKFRSGNAETPSDKLYNTSVLVAVHFDVIPLLHPSSVINHNVNGPQINDTFVKVGAFNRLGVAEGSLNFTLGYISEMRLVVQNFSNHWVILSEIFIEETSKSER